MKRTVVFFIVVFLTSCSPQRRLVRLLERYPIPADTIIQDTTIYRDSIIYETIAGDTVVDSITIPVEIDLPYMKITRHTAWASATAWLLDNQLGLELIQTDTIVEFVMDSVIVEREVEKVVTRTVVKEVYVKRKFWMHGFLVLAGLSVLVIVLWLLLGKRRGL